MQIAILLLSLVSACLCTTPIGQNNCVAASVVNTNWNYTIGAGQNVYLNPAYTVNGIATVNSILYTITFDGQQAWNFSSYAMQTIDIVAPGMPSASGSYIAAITNDANGNIYALTSNNLGLYPPGDQTYLYSVVALTSQGYPFWQATLLNVDSQQNPSIYTAGSAVYVSASFKGVYHVVSIDAATGKYNWQVPFNSTYGIFMYANVTQGSFVLLMNDQTLTALDAFSGQILFTETAPTYASFQLPILEENTLFVMVAGAVMPYISIYDLSNLQMPNLVGKYSLAMPALSMVYYSNVIYALEYGYIEAIDVSTLSAPVQRWNITAKVSQTSQTNLAISCGESEPVLFWNSAVDSAMYAISMSDGKIAGSYNLVGYGNMVGTMSLVSDQSLLFFTSQQEGNWPYIILVSIDQSLIQ